MVRALLICALVASASCVRSGGTYRCVADSECSIDGIDGICAVNFCAFPDPLCEGGFRYGEHSGPAAGTCADPLLSTEVTLGGEVTNLVGSNLVLRNNGGDDLLIAMSGPFTFGDTIVTGVPYEVTIAAQPSNPSQTCTVTNGSGTAGSRDITDVMVDCATTTHTVGGTVLGLVGSGLVLTNNGVDDKAVTGSGNVAFTFATAVPSGSDFDVQIKTQPSGQTCSVSGNTGTVGTANVTSVVVNCMAGTFTVGGMVSGLQGTVVLKNNTTDTATVTANGSFAFPTPLATSAMYDVTIGTQPSYPPRSQTCVVSNGMGTVGTTNVTSVSIACTTNSFTVGGTVTGLSGTLVIKNGTDMLTVTTSSFTFGVSVPSGNTYNVQIVTQPSGQTCSVTANATGTVGNGNVTNVTIACSTSGSDPGILCGAAGYCDPSMGEICCIDGSTSSCTTSCNAGGSRTPVRCDTQADCTAAGTPNLVCCGTVSGDVVYNTYCGGASQCTSPKAYYCDPNLAMPCPDGGTCMPTNFPFPGYYRCF